MYLSQVLLHVLFEHAAGYALFAVKEVEEIGMLLPQVSLFSCVSRSGVLSGVDQSGERCLCVRRRWRRAC